MMKLHEWEIWHTYSTYVESTDIDLADCAERLVEGGLAEFVTLRSGESFWRTPEGDTSRNGILCTLVRREIGKE
jgi:hypothetical protein